MKNKIFNLVYEMRIFLKLTLKNIWRNRRRTIITMSSIVIGTVTIILMQSYVNTMDLGLRAESIQKQYGHIQIASRGYFESDENSSELMMNEQVVSKIISKAMELDAIDFVNTRVHLNGIIGTQKNSTFFAAIAGLPSAEGVMAPTLIKGNLLSESDPAGVLIGEEMAKKLGVDTGDSLIAFVGTSSGSQEAIAVTIRGIYDALMPEQEKIIIYMPITSAWDLMLEKKTHRILIFLNNIEKQDQTMKTLNAFISENHLDLDVRSWETLAVFFKKIIGMFSGMITIIGFIVFLVIVFNIHNTMHMSIHERFREIGAMRAMGASRSEVIRSFLGEGFFIGILGAIAGIIIASVLIPWINSMHLHLPPGPGQDKPTPIVFTPTSAILLKALVVNFVTAFVASIMPAVKGSKIRIIDALRYV